MPVDRPRKSAVHDEGEQHLLDLRPRDAVVERALQMELELVGHVERREHRDHDEAPVPARELRPRPDVAEGVVHHELAHRALGRQDLLLGLLRVETRLPEQRLQDVEAVGAAARGVLGDERSGGCLALRSTFAPGDDLVRDARAGEPDGQSRIGTDLHEDLVDLLHAKAVVQATCDMRTQLDLAAERREHRDHGEAAVAAGERRPCPDLAGADLERDLADRAAALEEGRHALRGLRRAGERSQDVETPLRSRLRIFAHAAALTGSRWIAATWRFGTRSAGPASAIVGRTGISARSAARSSQRARFAPRQKWAP